MRASGVAILVGLAACGGEDPTTEALVGPWVNGDDGTERMIGFGPGGNYTIQVDGAEVQRGTYEVADDVLVVEDGEEVEMDDVIVWTVQYDASGTLVAGTQLGDPIYRYMGDEMDLRSASAPGGRRTWVRDE